MLNLWKQKQKKISNLKQNFPLFCACFIVVCLLAFPEAMLYSGAESLSLWFSKVFPSLFPFMVASGILIHTGGADILGAFFKPFMYPIFRLSGISAFPFILGLFSGYPVGAKLTATLYEEKKISLADAEHILSFSNNAGPLFLIGTVATGFFQTPIFGYALLLSSILGAILTGFLYRFFKPPTTKISSHFHTTQKTILPFSDILSLTIQDSLSTIFQIGGYILFFNVFITALEELSFFHILHQILFFLPFSTEFFQGFLGGILEMTNGSFALSQSPDSIRLSLTATCMLVSFGGFSIMGQTFSILKNVPIQKSRYILCKCLNGCFSGIFFFASFPFFERLSLQSTSVFYVFTNTFFSLQPYIYYGLFYATIALLSQLIKK